MKVLSGLLLICLCLPALAGTYRWVDENGVVHYSDRPRENAEEITIRGAQTYSARPGVRPSSGAPAAASPGEAEAAGIYQSLTIVRPAEQETFRNIGGQLPVSLSLVPGLQRTHSIRVYYDGQLISSWPSQGLRHTLTDVYRGEHNLRAEVVDEQGSQVAASETVTFFVHQTNLLNRVRN